MEKTIAEMLDFIIKETSENGSLIIDFNECRTCYRTVAQEIEMDVENDDDYFINEEDMKKCAENDTLWSFYWHKRTPVGHYMIRASSFELGLKEVYRMALEGRAEG